MDTLFIQSAFGSETDDIVKAVGLGFALWVSTLIQIGTDGVLVRTVSLEYAFMKIYSSKNKQDDHLIFQGRF